MNILMEVAVYAQLHDLSFFPAGRSLLIFMKQQEQMELILECLHGFTSIITKTPNARILCLRFSYNIKVKFVKTIMRCQWRGEGTQNAHTHREASPIFLGQNILPKVIFLDPTKLKS